jgi:hypothetical protein
LKVRRGRLSASVCLGVTVAIGAGLAVVNPLSTTVASAACVGLHTGSYLGTFERTNPPGSYFGAVAMDVVVTNFVTGRTAFLTGSTGSGSFDCSTFSGSGNSGLHLLATAGSIFSDGSLTGIWSDGLGHSGVFAAGLSSPPTPFSASNAGTHVSTLAPSPINPVAARVMSTTVGPMSVVSAPVSGLAVPGFSMLNAVLGIEAPVATFDSPLQILIAIDPSVVTSDPSDIRVFENGQLVPQGCGTAASPITVATDPCAVIPPYVQPGTGIVVITVLSTHASTWSLGLSCGFAIENQALPAASLNSPYSSALLACGGTATYKFKKVGKLPNGIKLSSSGVFSGSPQKAGTYPFSVTLTDKAKPKHSVTKPFTIVVG